jgi:hypothetical protein
MCGVNVWRCILCIAWTSASNLRRGLCQLERSAHAARLRHPVTRSELGWKGHPQRHWVIPAESSRDRTRSNLSCRSWGNFWPLHYVWHKCTIMVKEGMLGLWLLQASIQEGADTMTRMGAPTAFQSRKTSIRPVHRVERRFRAIPRTLPLTEFGALPLPPLG